MSASIKDPPLGETKVPCFDEDDKYSHKGREYDRQLYRQESAINEMTVGKYLEGRGKFEGKKTFVTS